MEVKLMAGVVVRMIDKEKREEQWPVQGQARLRRWSVGEIQRILFYFWR